MPAEWRRPGVARRRAGDERRASSRDDRRRGAHEGRHEGRHPVLPERRANPPDRLRARGQVVARCTIDLEIDEPRRGDQAGAIESAGSAVRRRTGIGPDGRDTVALDPDRDEIRGAAEERAPGNDNWPIRGDGHVAAPTGAAHVASTGSWPGNASRTDGPNSARASASIASGRIEYVQMCVVAAG